MIDRQTTISVSVRCDICGKPSPARPSQRLALMVARRLGWVTRFRRADGCLADCCLYCVHKASPAVVRDATEVNVP